MNTVKFKYIFSDDYKTNHITGVYGGITSCGDLEAHFYYERSALPREMEYEVTENGSLGQVVGVKPEEHKIIRNIVGGVTMSREMVYSLRDWLNDRIAEMEGHP